jgi:hypothetical protein
MCRGTAFLPREGDFRTLGRHPMLADSDAGSISTCSAADTLAARWDSGPYLTASATIHDLVGLGVASLTLLNCI